MIDEHYQIGEVAERVGLSLRTIRYYEEIGLVAPSGRTEGGFRLYTDTDVDRLRLVKTLKPVGLTLEELAELLGCVDRITGAADGDRAEAEIRFGEVLAAALRGCNELEESVTDAREALSRLETLKSGTTR